MLKRMFAFRSAPKVKRIARWMFWLALFSAYTRHDLLLGAVLYLIAVAVVLVIAVSPLLMAGGCLLAWYWYRHRRLPGWLSRRLPTRLRRVSVRRMSQRARDWLMDVFPGHTRPVRRRWPRPPASSEASTKTYPVLVAPDRAQQPADLESTEAADPQASTPLP